MAASLTRLFAAVAAVVVCAWFALGIRQAHDIAHASSVISRSNTLTPAELRSLDSALHDAGTLNPDAEVDILRARAAIKAGDARLAQQILETVTREEPRNLEAWIWLAGAALDDPALGHRALAKIDQLDPRAR